MRPLHRPRDFERESRWKKKKLTKTSWYRPHNTVCFVPGTPGGLLAKEIQGVVNEELARLNLKAKVMETGGRSLKQHLVKMDLTGCIYPDCYLCECGAKGGSHTRAGSHYSGVCLECEQSGTVARYDGETGRSAYWRSTHFHKKEILKNDTKNAFTKHLNVFHKGKLQDPTILKLKVDSNHSKCLDRHIKEGIWIKNNGASKVMNSKSEYHQPAVKRVVIQ